MSRQRGLRQRRGSEFTALGASYDVTDQDSQSVDEVHLRDFLRALYKRRWTAISVLLVVVAVATAHVFTVTPRYEASVQLLFEADRPAVVTFDDGTLQERAQDDYYQTQFQILRSRRLARTTLDALGLWDHPQFRSGGGNSEGFLDRLFSRWREEPEPLNLVNFDTEVTEETLAQSRAIDKFLGDLDISNRVNTRLASVRFESADPILAAQVANSHAEAYIDQNLEFGYLAFREAFDKLTERLEDQRQQVEESDMALQQFREENNLVTLDNRQNIVVGELSDLNSAVTIAKTDRIQKEGLYNQLLDIQNDRSALDTFPAIMSNQFIQEIKSQLATLAREEAQLAETLGDRHPDLIRVRLAKRTAELELQDEIDKVVQSVRNEYLAAVAHERDLNAALSGQTGQALAQTRNAIEYEALERVARSNRQIFETLLNRAKETGISSELSTSNVRIVDAAEVPTVPIYPQKRTILLVALALGAIMAVSVAFFLEYLDDRINSPDQIKASLGLRFLGMVPSIAMHSAKDRQGGPLQRLRRARGNRNGTGPSPAGPRPLMNNGVPPNFAEFMRGLRSNVLFSSAEKNTRSFLITSAGPGEGKTVVASNFAVALATGHVGRRRATSRSQNRVLLVDTDMRSPQVHGLFDESLEPGLSDLIANRARLSEVVRPTTIPRLWILPAGVPPANPTDLLGTRRFREIIHALGEEFDWLVIDSAPVMAVIDACQVAQAGSSVVFVIGAEKTTRRTAQLALEQLGAAKAKFVGAVLNNVDLNRNPYYYSPYYSRSYGKYYVDLPAEKLVPLSSAMSDELAEGLAVPEPPLRHDADRAASTATSADQTDSPDESDDEAPVPSQTGNRFLTS